MKSLFFVVFWGLSFFSIHKTKAQELNCTVILNTQRLQTQETQIVGQIKTAIEQFMNTTKWTNDTYAPNERIKCTIYITFDAGSDIPQGKYAATVQIQSIRPVHGTNYETPMLNFFDRNFSFDYAPSQPLIFSENTYTTNLTASLAFYAYMILAMDQDSFANMGGSPFYERILNIVNISIQAGGGGWSSNDSRNRYWLSENLNSPQFLPLREAFYTYHRLVLDDFLNNTDEKRKQMLEVLRKIKQVQDLRPNSVAINAFFDAKNTELINIFSQGEEATVAEAVELLARLDPPNASKYKRLLP